MAPVLTWISLAEALAVYGDTQAYDTFKNDIWAVGIIFMLFFCDTFLWSEACPDIRGYRHYLRAKDRAGWISSRCAHRTTPGAAVLISRALEPEPDLRITLTELRHGIQLLGGEVYRLEPYNEDEVF